MKKVWQTKFCQFQNGQLDNQRKYFSSNLCENEGISYKEIVVLLLPKKYFKSRVCYKHVIWVFIIFLRRHSNESCNLIGSQCSLDFPIYPHQHSYAFASCQVHPSLSYLFKKYIPFCCLGIIFKQIKLLNTLLILSFLSFSLKSLWLPTKTCFQREKATLNSPRFQINTLI